MGYTHYFRRNEKEIQSKDWAAFESDVKALTKSVMDLGIGITCEDDWSKPIKKADEIIKKSDSSGRYINLNGDRSKNLDHDNLLIFERDVTFNGLSFCKTNRKDYDMLVSGILILLHNQMAYAFRVSSDGNLNDSEWIKSLTLLTEVFPDREFELPPNTFGPKVVISKENRGFEPIYIEKTLNLEEMLSQVENCPTSTDIFVF